MTFNPTEHLRQISRKNKKSGQTESHDYLDVKWRIVWFRDENPHGTIETEMVHFDGDKGLAIFKATATREDGGSATGYGSETIGDWTDYIEKAETKSIGRALAALKYGTQFAPELDEQERIVDSPVERFTPPQEPPEPSIPMTGAEAVESLIRDRLNALAPEAKRLGVCKTPKEFLGYIAKVLNRAEVSVSTLNLADLEEVTTDLLSRGHRAEEEGNDAA